MTKQGMTKGWQRRVERSIPFLARKLARGVTPTRVACKSHALGQA